MKKKSLFIRIAQLVQIPMALLLIMMSWNYAKAVYGYGAYVERMLPNKAGNTGPVTLNVLGEFPQNILKVVLWDPQSNEVPGTLVEVQRGAYEKAWGGKGDILTAKFDLTGALTGEYSISIVDADNPEAWEYGSRQLTVENGTSPRLWVDITGVTVVRVGSNTNYMLSYGNSGNTDVSSGVLFIGIPKGVSYTLGFNLADYQLPQYSTDVDPQGDSGKFDSEIDATQYEIFKLYVKDIKPVSSKPLQFTINWGSTPTDYIVRAWWAGSKPVGYHPIWPEN